MARNALNVIATTLRIPELELILRKDFVIKVEAATQEVEADLAVLQAVEVAAQNPQNPAGLRTALEAVERCARRSETRPPAGRSFYVFLT